MVDIKVAKTDFSILNNGFQSFHSQLLIQSG